MRLAVQVEPAAGIPADVDYRWDPDTEILSAHVRSPGDTDVGVKVATAADSAMAVQEPTVPASFGADSSLSGAVELEGPDGSWIVLDLEAGHLAGVEVAVWPNVRRRASLLPPSEVEDARIRVPGRRRSTLRGVDGPSALEVTTLLSAESDLNERTIHFRLGPPRRARSLRLGRDLLVDVDADGHLAGLWLLNVPPAPRIT